MKKHLHFIYHPAVLWLALGLALSFTLYKLGQAYQTIASVY